MKEIVKYKEPEQGAKLEIFEDEKEIYFKVSGIFDLGETLKKFPILNKIHLPCAIKMQIGAPKKEGIAKIIKPLIKYFGQASE